MYDSKLNFKQLPLKPGVYIFKDKYDNIIYIGKAKNLKSRINQYFQNNHNSIKTKFLVKNIYDLDYIIVSNEVEALLLENKLIKKHKPKYNINLKDNKTYPYIKISDEKIPKIYSTRTVTGKGDYFGPYSDTKLRDTLIKIIIEVFNLITKKTYNSKSNLYYEIGLAPKENYKDINIQEYIKNVEKAKKFLKGNTKEVLSILKKQMYIASQKEQFEIANIKKQQIEIIKNIENQNVTLLKKFDQDVIVIISDKNKENSLIQILNINHGIIIGKKEYRFDYYDNELLKEFIKMYYSKNPTVKEIIINENIFNSQTEKKQLEKYLSKFRKSKVEITIPKKAEKYNLLKIALNNAKSNFKDENVLYLLKNTLQLNNKPNIIECFDISNLNNNAIVAGMTQFINGQPEKSGYRRFEIKNTKTQNDYKSIEEVIYRRYKKLKFNNEIMPDLIIIDGGKGQLSSAVKSLKNLGLSIPIISIAKKEEEIFILGKKEPIKLNKNSKLMLFLRYIRDTTHNFTISYNRYKRIKEYKN